MESNDYFIYRHYKLSDGKPFYIGLGHGRNHQRAYYKYNRNRLWKSIVKNNKWGVEILADNLSREEACELEDFLIKCYGKIYGNTGILANVLDGCAGSRTSEQIEHWKNSTKGFQDGPKNHRFNKPSADLYQSVKVIHIETGRIFDSIKDAQKDSSTNLSSFKSQLNAKCNKSGYQKLWEYLDYKPTCECYSRGRKVIDTSTKIVYNTVAEAADILGLGWRALESKLQGKSENNTSFLYLSDYESGILPYKSKYLNSIIVLDTETGIYYDNLKEASEAKVINYSRLKAMLNGQNKNKTSLIRTI